MKRLNKKVVKLPLAVAASIGIATPFIAHTQDTNTLITDKVLVLEQTSAHDFHVSLDNVFDIVTGLQLELILKGNAIPDVAELQAVSDDYLLTTTYNENVLTIVMTAKEELTKTGDQLEVGKLSFQSPQNAIGTLEIANASYKIITEKNESEQGDLSVPNESFVLNTKPVIEDKRESTTTIVEGSTFDPMSLVESGEIIATDAEDGEGVTITATPTAVDTSLPGVQTITYTAIDSAGETATLDIQLGIIASPYTVPPVIMGVQEYVTIVQNRPFDPKADVSAVDEKGNPVVVEVTGTLDVTTPGVYTLTYRASDRDKNTTTLTSTITVKANEKPVIHGIENTTIIVGESFDILAGVSVTDAEDGKISNEQLNIKGSVNVNIPGIYRISYEVTDSDGATTFVERIITVNERLSGMNSIPTIQAGNSTLIVGEAFDPYKGISAQDKEDGDLTDKIEVIANNVDTSKAGVYEVTYKVTDSQGASATKTVYVSVNERLSGMNSIPTIQAGNSTLIVGEAFDPYKGISAQDKEDGDLTDKIEVIANNVDTSKAGVYEVTYKVTDSQGASATKTVYVSVNERLSGMNSIPTIQAGNSTLIVGEAFDPYKGISAQDKEDGDLTDKIEVIANNVDTSKAGVYEVTYKVTDSQGASATKTVYVSVNERLSGMNSIPTIQAGNSTLIVGETFDPYKGISAQDKEDGDLTDKIEVIANNVDTSKAGVYEVTYKVTDSQGASATKTVYVSVEGVEVTIDPELKAIITNPDIISEVSGFGTMENPLMVGVRSDVTVELVTEYVKQLNEAMKTSKKVVSQDGYVYYYLTLVNSKTRADGTIYVTIRINQEQTDVIRIVDQYFGLDNNQIIPPTENEGGSTDTSTPNEENGNSESQLNQLPNLGMQLAQLFIGIGAAILAISGVVLFFMRRK